MPNIDLRQPELADIESAFVPGEDLDFLGYSSAVVDDLQVDPFEELSVICGIARVGIRPLEVEYRVPVEVDGRSERINYFPALMRINSGNGNWGLPSGLIDGSRYRSREDWLASWHVLELMQIPGIPSFDELADAEAREHDFPPIIGI
jgi:hypothetical protein